MVTVSLRFEDTMKKELDEMCDAMGMNLTTFFMIYAKEALRERRIPFDIVAPKDPFYSKSNMEALAESMKQAENGEMVTLSMAELEAMAQ